MREARDEYERLVTENQSRDIKELSVACDKFYEVVQKNFPAMQENNEVIKAMYDVLGAAELQGFVYGYMEGSRRK